MARSRFQFGIRSLLLIPLLCASACCGWQANAHIKQQTHRQRVAEVEQSRELLQELFLERSAYRRSQYKALQYDRKALQNRIERAEHERRFNRARMLRLDPTGTSYSLPDGI